MTIRVVRLGTERAADEGLRIGTVRRPPRGVPKTEFAKQDDVVILRTVNGQRMAGLYNIGAIRRGAYDDPAIFANDIVVVGDSPQRRLFRDFVSVAPLLAAPVVAILQQ